MTKLKRKLNEYLSGEKKAPKGKVKFCPLSPCKRQRTPIFQLHKHLQSSTHKLQPSSPSYVRALDKAPRVSLKDLGSYINDRQKRRKKRMKENSTEDDHTSEDESHENNSRQVTEEQTATKIKGSEAFDMRVNDCDEKRGSEEIEIEEHLSNTDSEEEHNSDEEYKALARRVRNQERRKSENARVLFYDEKLKKGKLAEDGMTKRKKKKTASDEEYDHLAEKVWSAKQHTSTSDRYRESDLGSRGKESQIGNTDSADDGYERNLQNESEATIGGTCSNKSKDTIVLSESDETDDTEYNPKEESDTDQSSESSSTETSSLSQERDHLLTELVEVLGKGKCKEGSFLDCEEPWREEINDFIRMKASQGYTFKTPAESFSDLTQTYKEKEEGSQEEVFQEIFQGDASDNDEALDPEWVPSDCETDAQASRERVLQNEEEVSGKDVLLSEFYCWLIDVDGGYRNEKVAQQYKSQVKSVVHRLALTETVTTNKQGKCPSVHLLLIPGKEGDSFLKTWLSYAVKRYQPGTVRSYLMSLRLFYKFLMQEHKNIANVTVETLNARRELMTSWSSAQKKKVAKRKLEKRDEDFKKLLSSDKLFKICHGNQHVNAVKQLGSSSEHSSGGRDVSKILSDKSHCEVRDWLITRLLIDNSGRSGIAANMKISEFQEAVYYPGTVEDQARYRILVTDHKTAGVYGAAVVWLYDDLYKLIEMYLRTVRSQISTLDPKVEQVFVSSNGLALTSSQVSTCLYRTCQREGIKTKGRICATIVRKSLATKMHQQMPDEQEHLAALAQHKTRMQADYYRVHDKVSQTDLGRRAVKKLVSLKPKEIHKKEQEPASWTKEEEEKLQQLFKEEIATGSVNESEIKEKVSTTNLLEAHSFKAIVLKLRRISTEHRKDIPLPNEQMTSSEKVMNFLSSTRFESDVSASVNAPSLQSNSSRFWRKFTDEQTSHLLSLTKDLMENNAVKRELVWQRVQNDLRSQELGLITGEEDEEETRKCKQRLTDKVRQEMRRVKRCTQKKK